MKTLVLASSLALLLSTAVGASAADLVKGYEKGANLPAQLGSDFIFDEAALGGGDATLATAPASYGWVSEYTDLWDVGTNVSITGLAIPIHSNTNAGANTTQDGDWTFTFFELDGGADPNGFDGYDFGAMTGESVIGSVVGTFSNHSLGGNQTDEYFLEFDSPLNFTSASSGLAFHMQSTNTMRVKVNTPGAARRADRVSLVDGTPVAGANSSFAATLAGTPIAFPPPPPPAVAHRLDASLETPGNRIWETLAPSFEQFALKPPTGDYNGDAITDAADYTVWRDNLGGDAATAFAVGSRDSANAGVISQDDYNSWDSGFGSTIPKVAVSDPAVPGITQAFATGATGQAGVYETLVNGVFAGRQDASFEIWFNPDDLAGGDQVLFEIGGTGTGSYLSLQGDQLSFYVNGQFDGNEQTLTTTLSDADWTQVAVVIHNTFSASDVSADDYVELYVDGVLVEDTSLATTDINRWAGGNQAGLGQDGGNLAAGGPISGDTNNVIEFPFAGEIAIFEYEPGAWTAQDVLDRYNAITSPPAISTPEPATSVVLVIGYGLISVSCRRR